MKQTEGHQSAYVAELLRGDWRIVVPVRGKYSRTRPSWAGRLSIISRIRKRRRIRIPQSRQRQRQRRVHSARPGRRTFAAKAWRGSTACRQTPLDRAKGAAPHGAAPLRSLAAKVRLPGRALMYSPLPLPRLRDADSAQLANSRDSAPSSRPRRPRPGVSERRC
jgi:hypothetical protein